MAWADKWLVELAAASTPLGNEQALAVAAGGRSGDTCKLLTAVERIRRLNRPCSPTVAIQFNQMSAPDPCLAIAQ